MTDNEIIKALEKSAKKLSTYKDNIFRLSLDLINRQKAELKKNENIIRLADKTIETQNAEIERLKQAKAEAVKEFAELLDNKAMFPHEINDDYAVGLTTIKNFLKELVGEQRKEDEGNEK